MDSKLLYLLSTLYLIWIFRSLRYQKKAAKLVQDFTTGANEAAQETFSLMRTVRVYGTERKEFGRFKQWLVKVAFVNIRESVAYGFWCIIAVVLGGISIMSGHVSAEQLIFKSLALWYKLHNDLASTLEQRAILENEMLRRQDEELQCLFPQTDHAVPSYLEYYPVEKEKSLVNHGVTNPDLGGLIWLPQEGFCSFFCNYCLFTGPYRAP
ncbi:unnamed protein product [Prunus armeniaca]|uniref:ABC transmembrane type-1 domain-containing protein n=1 Tax=Prunus armeniaca TaxID=36596 RepID=A0A6J5XGK5_PRUAR|nr:unnamed protein product [Prunus armeniaca]